MKVTKLARRICSILMVITMLMTMFDVSILVYATNSTDTTTETVSETEGGESVDETEGGESVDETESADGTQDTEEDIPVDAEAVDVSSADELEQAINDGASQIRIVADFEIDRTFYITQDTQIYSDESYTITRSADFGGDIFIVGEASDGTDSEFTVIFTLGNPDSDIENLLIIDGNKDNMATDVTGTAIFVCNEAQADIYKNVTITNCKKIDNQKTTEEKYGLSYTNRIGGAAVILASGTMNIYGTVFTNNEVNDETSSEEDGMISTQGGAVYSFGLLNIYGSTFENNHAARGGAIYNYRETHIYNAEFTGNSASYRGGAVYMANSTQAAMYFGEENNSVESKVIFDGNTSVNNGGAIYAQAILTANETTFINNEATEGHGGAIAAADKITEERTLTVTNSDFESNTSYYNGGAVYLSGGSESYFENVNFTSNASLATANSEGSRYGGGALYSTGSTFELQDVVLSENTSEYNAGAIALYSQSSAILNNVTAGSNKASSNGGALYANKSQAEIYGGTFSANEANMGGAVYNTGATVTAEGTELSGNSSASNGGAVALYSSTEATLTDVTLSDNSSDNTGGGLYSNGSTVTMYSAAFSGNSSAANGGALYSTGSAIEIDGAQFAYNTAGSNGGAVAIHTSTELIMNDITATENEAAGKGGFLYNNNSALSIYNSSISDSYAKSHGGAVALEGTSVNNIYATTFTGNSCGDESTKARGGAIYVMTDSTKTLTHSCTFNNNTATEFGGAVYVANGSELVMYNTVANNNSAPKGGMLYETVKGTVVTLNGVTVSGNTASDGGPIIWGNTLNATLNINKNNFTDLDYQGDLDDEYWAGAIVNLLTVYDLEFSVPGYTDYGQEESQPGTEDSSAIVGITTAKQLEQAISLGYTKFRIDADFEIDRTIYITANTHIYSDEAHTLTRAADFAGDMFVVGEGSDGEILSETVTLTLGKTDSQENNLLTINGNADNMTVDVSGTGIFVCGTAQVDIYPNITITDCKKTANSRTLDDKYGLSYRNRIGGAAVILASGTLNIYGGIISGNSINDEASSEEDGMISTQGGAIYSFGSLNIYGGKFENNHAARGGAIYNYRETHIYNAEFTGNTASYRGGAVYMANSTQCKMYLGESVSGSASKVTFQNNTSADRGGAVYAQGIFKANNTEFKNNIAESAGGAIASSGNESITEDKIVTVTNSLFEGNQGAGGGAVGLYYSTTSLFSNVTFTKNISSSTGGAFVTSGSDVKMYNITFTENESTGNGGAFYSTGSTFEIDGAEFTGNSAQGYGGAISMHRVTDTQVITDALMNDITASGNSAVKAGGFLYNNHSQLNMYNSDIKNNHSDSNGGAIAFLGVAVSNIYGTKFTENSCGAEGTAVNGGAFYVYTDATNTMTHSCTFEGNSSSNFGGAVYASKGSTLQMYNTIAKNNTALKGGFLYETTTGTVVTLNGTTVSGNVATDGGPIIWGNTTNATLRINKGNYTDLGHEGELDSTYWSEAIVNKLTVEEISEDIPKYLDYGNESYDEIEGAVDVASIQELESALNNKTANIRVVADITVDRTLYVTSDTTIFSTISRVIRRAPGFAGDIFVIGEDSQGNSAVADGKNAVLTLGNPYSETKNLLTLDGNSDNMTVDVAGTVLFLSESAQVDIYDNVSIINNHKVSNIRTFDEKYLFGETPNRPGGAAVIIASGTLNVYGGLFKNNVVNEEVIVEGDDTGRNSSLGGAIYNRGNLYIYGGTFEENEGARGGAIYNSRMIKLYEADFINNHATAQGGAIYMAGTEFSQLYAGDISSTEASEKIFFKGNYSDGGAGAIYCSTKAAVVIYGETTFEGNKTPNGNGAAISSYGMVNANHTIFRDNQAYSRGGAVYISNANEDVTTRIVGLTDCTFTNNTARYGGAVGIYASSGEFEEGGIAEITNCTFTENKAINTTASETNSVYGGAIYNSRKGSLTVTGSTFTGNTAFYEGGAIYSSDESTTVVTDSAFELNTVESSEGRGGAVSVHSATLDFDNTVFTQNSAGSNGGALYVSYASASLVNSVVNVANSSFSKNTSGNYGGAVYVTQHQVEEDATELTVTNTNFEENTAAARGGAVYLTTSSDAYMKDATFTKNTAHSDTKSSYGGAVYVNAANLEIDGGEFTENTAKSSGGAIMLNDSADAVLNNITATGNTAQSNGGFIYSSSSDTHIYSSNIKNNTASNNGGALALYNLAITEVYNTDIAGNSAGNNGGAVYSYAAETEATFNTCTFTENNADNFGGVAYASNKSITNFYNIQATSNTALKGGFLYETVTDTVVNMNGITVSGNSSTEEGPLVFGNSENATLNIHKINYTDSERNDTADDAYWDYAIVNLLTVNDISGVEDEIPPCGSYVGKETDDDTETEKVPVPVTDVLSLGLKSDDGVISASYGNLERLDNSSNFMSRNTTAFDNINGETVTVDSYVYHPDNAANNGNVGEGLMIYQAILYKQAHPEEDVYIDIASFRFSMSAAVNINRNSRYFGYMRNLAGVNYDKYGFVRISYLLVTAAKMGINVTVVGQLDGYPQPATDPTFDKYFESYLDELCDPAYVADGKIGDYMNFQACQWTSYEDKASTDMMHIKMCAVSHYLDMNGVGHKNAVWSSSSNLDGVNGSGTNGNNKLQTATIVSNHEYIYRAAHNYINLVSQYCGQEEVYLFRQIANARATAQIDLILAGRGSEINQDEQIVYLGTENDDVFEFYFAPFGGDALNWDEAYNPYCKYLRKLRDSDDYIYLAWNNANYNRSSSLILQMEGMISTAFHQNASPENKLYLNLEEFDTSVFSDLVVGEDIGFKSFNKKEFGGIHSKDMQMSYSENGERHYVSLLNSMNIHSGSMSYQSNFMLVINEDNCDEDSVFFTIADNTTKGMVEHTYGNEESYIPETKEDGYVYKQCMYCDKRIILSKIHRPSDWLVAKEATAEKNGISYIECEDCGEILEAKESIGKSVDLSNSEGMKFSAGTVVEPAQKIESIPYTFEAVVNVPESVEDRAGVIIGNYKLGVSNLMSFEIYSGGRVRLYYKSAGVPTDCTFDTDIRSDKKEHIAITVDGTTATLYVNGEAVETKTLGAPLPNATENLKIGGDNRAGNAQYFKGTLYSLALFGDVRTADEIKEDMIYISADSDSLLLSETLGNDEPVAEDTVKTVVKPAGETFTYTKYYTVGELESAPRTFEATLNVPVSQTDRAGVVVSNFNGGNDPQIAIEIYSNGKPRLFYVSDGTRVDCTFNTDIRSDKLKHIAIVVDGTEAILYVDGVKTETKSLSVAFPDTKDNFAIGGDHRSENSQYFKGTIYSVSLFGDARTAEEVKKDAVLVTADSESLLYSGYFTKETGAPSFMPVSGHTFSETEIKDMYEVENGPHTFEAVINVPKSVEDRAGVIIGNYKAGVANLISYEVYSGGRVRLYSKTNSVPIDCTFDTDIRSDVPEHIVVTVDGTTATLYVNGEAVETKTLGAPLPNSTKDFKIGGDNRANNTQYFKGTIYSAALYSDAKTADEIKDGLICNTDEILYCSYFTTMSNVTSVEQTNGKEFTSDKNSAVPIEINSAPYTFEASVQVPKNIEGRAGVILGNYTLGRRDLISFEVYTKGRVRLYSKTAGVPMDCTFDTDIRSDKKEHIAITVDGTTATLYVNGEAAETKTLSAPLPNVTQNLKIGGDDRLGNTQYFKGKIYSVALFSDVRTAEEVANDSVSVSNNEDNLLYNTNYASGVCDASSTGGAHIVSDWIIEREPTETTNGYKYKKCTECGTVIEVNEYSGEAQEGLHIDYKSISGMTFASETDAYKIDKAFDTVPLTYEVLFKLPKSYRDRAGVLIGNYDGGSGEQVNIEIYNNGKPRLYFKTNQVASTYMFTTDVRSDSITHLAITVDGTKATMFINGVETETVTLSREFASATENFVVGADNRLVGPQYFKGEIYGVNLFSDVRSAEEIKLDTIMVPYDTEGLVFSKYFTE